MSDVHKTEEVEKLAIASNQTPRAPVVWCSEANAGALVLIASHCQLFNLFYFHLITPKHVLLTGL